MLMNIVFNEYCLLMNIIYSAFCDIKFFLLINHALSLHIFHFQSVTGTEQADDHNSYWAVRGKHQDHCDRGQDYLFV